MNIQPAFTPAFFVPFGDIAASTVRQAPAQKPVLFSDDAYRGSSMQHFMASPDFARCQQEYVQLLDRIVEFAETNADKIVPPLSGNTVATIRQDFDLLKNHLTDLNDDFFSSHKPLIYGIGKEMFHELDALLNNPGISFQKRLDAIQTMAPQVGMCSGGLLAVASDAISSLKHSTAGLKGAAYRTKIQMIDALISQHVSASHDYSPGNEVHFINVYFNYVADDLGVPARRDLFTSIAESAISTDQLNACKEKILSRLTPNRLTNAMADDYLGRIKGAAADANINVNRPVADAQLTALFTATQELRTAHLDQEFGQVPETGYLLPVADTYQYQLAKKPTLLARHFIEHLRHAELVDHAATLRIARGDAATGDIMQLGDLFWREKDGSCEEISANDLLQVSPHQVVQALNDARIPGPLHGTMLQHFAQHVLDANHLGLAQPIHEEWLKAFAGVFSTSSATDKEWIVPVVFLAAALNQAATLQTLIDGGADLNAKNAQGMSATMVAALLGQSDALTALVRGGADLTTTDPHGWTAVMIAASEGHAGALHALRAGGANLNATSPGGETAVMFAAENGHDDALRALVAGEANLDAMSLRGKSAVMFAAENGNTDALRVLVAGGADLDATSPHGMTAVMLAAENGHADALQALTAGAVDLNAKGPGGMTAVMFAASNDHAGALQALIAGGADLNATDPFGMTVSMIAAGKGHAAALQALVAGEANLDAKNPGGKTAVMFAARNGHADALQALIAGKPDLDVMDLFGMTAVMSAANAGQAGALHALIAGGADLDAADSTGRNAVMIAAKNGHADALQALIAGRANLNAPNSIGTTAVMLAAARGHVGALQALIAGGADLGARNRYGMAAVTFATNNGHADAMAVLVAAGAEPGSSAHPENRPR